MELCLRFTKPLSHEEEQALQEEIARILARSAAEKMEKESCSAREKLRRMDALIAACRE